MGAGIVGPRDRLNRARNEFKPTKKQKNNNFLFFTNKTICAIQYLWYKFKNVKNTHGGMLVLVKLQPEACNFTQSKLLHGCFSRFFNCRNGTKLRKASRIKQNGLCYLIFYSFPFSVFVVLCRIYCRTQESAKAIGVWVRNGFVADSFVPRFF